MSRRSVADLLDRTITLGRQRAAIDQDVGLHRLSCEAWIRKCVELGSFDTLEQLEVLAAEIKTGCPHLSHEIEVRAELWNRGPSPQDRPAIWDGFGDPDRSGPGSYSELVAFGVGVERASAIASWLAGCRRPDSSFGRLADWSELAEALQPIDSELAELDQAIAAALRVADLSWHQGRPQLVAGGVTVQVGPDTLAIIATTIASLVGRPLALAA